MSKGKKKNRKTLLVAAVLSALEIGSMANNIGLSMISTTEASETYPSISMGTVGGPYTRKHMGGSTEHTDSGTFGNSATVTVKWNPSKNRYGVYYKVTQSRFPFCGQEQDAYDNYGYNTFYYFGTDQGAVSTYSISNSNAESAYAVAKMLNANIESGVFINEDKIKDMLKGLGIDTTGSTIKVEKPLNTKDISANGNISATGNISAGGNLDVNGSSHIKGNEKVDGKLEVGGDATIHGSETVDRNLTVKGDETVNGNSTVGKDSHIKGSETVDKNLTVHGSETVDGNSHVKGNSETDGNSTTHGSETVDKDLTVKGNTKLGDDKNNDTVDVYAKTNLHGDTTVGDNANDKFTVNATSEFKSNATFDKNVKIKGDTSMDGKLDVGGDTHLHSNAEIDKNLIVHGNQTIDKDATVYGNTDLKGDLRVENNARILGDTQLGDNKNKDKVDVWAKAFLHGDTTIGDDENDKFVVNATSEFKGDATFDKNVHIKGDQTVDGNQVVGGDNHVKGNQKIDKDLAVHGSATIDGDLTTKGDTYTLGNQHIGKNLTVDGSAKIAKDLQVEGTTDTGALISRGDAVVGGDTHIYGSTEIDKNLTVHGDTILDGGFFSKGAAQFGSNVDVKNNLHVGGDASVDGDVYGKSFNVGNERYIDKDGINANGHKIRNVADGEIGPNSLDAVNGRQLWHTREALQHNISQVGAQTAAMANLHPMDFEYGDKFSLAAAIGGYQDQQAFALGAFMKPTQKSMVSLTGTLGMSQNMYGLGYTQKFGKKADFEHMTETQLHDELAKLDKDAAEIREHDKQLREENGKLKAEISDLKSEIAKSNKQDVAQENQLAALSAKNADLEKAYSQLMSKVDSMAAELAKLKKASQK